MVMSVMFVDSATAMELHLVIIVSAMQPTIHVKPLLEIIQYVIWTKYAQDLVSCMSELISVFPPAYLKQGGPPCLTLG